MADENDIQSNDENESEVAGSSGEAESQPRSGEPDHAEAEQARETAGARAGTGSQTGAGDSAGEGSAGPRKLQRSIGDRYIAGVCGGLGDYFQIDPLLVRLGWVIAALVGGIGFIAYIVAWIFIPEDTAGKSATPPPRDSERSRKMGLLAGAALIVLGLCFLFDEMGFRYLLPLQVDFYHHDFEVLIALAIIVAGVWLLLGKSNRSHAGAGGGSTAGAAGGGPTAKDARAGRKRLTRSLHDRKIAGVCGGLADYINIDSSLVRVAVVVIVLLTHFYAALVYIAMAIIVPEE